VIVVGIVAPFKAIEGIETGEKAKVRSPGFFGRTM
jgi:hypothetical protein